MYQIELRLANTDEWAEFLEDDRLVSVKEARCIIDQLVRHYQAFTFRIIRVHVND